MTTGATQAPARSAASAPSVKASRNVPRFASATWNRDENREKSISMTSNIASARSTKTMAMARLNQGDELMVPKVPAVRMTISPSTP